MRLRQTDAPRQNSARCGAIASAAGQESLSWYTITIRYVKRRPNCSSEDACPRAARASSISFVSPATGYSSAQRGSSNVNIFTSLHLAQRFAISHGRRGGRPRSAPSVVQYTPQAGFYSLSPATGTTAYTIQQEGFQPFALVLHHIISALRYGDCSVSPFYRRFDYVRSALQVSRGHCAVIAKAPYWKSVLPS